MAEPRSGHVMLNIRIDVSDAEAFVQAGRRSYGRDLAGYSVGTVPAIPDDAEEIIPDPGQAAADLLVEAWVRCYMPYTSHGPLIEVVDSAEWGDVDNKGWFPDEDEED